MIRLLMIICLFTISLNANSAQFNCKVDRKIDSDRTYKSEDIEKYQFSAVLELDGENVTIKRCSFETSANMVTCDSYKADYFDHNKRNCIMKAYNYEGHHDLQIFYVSDENSLCQGDHHTFVENNGRGIISFGKCTLKD